MEYLLKASAVIVLFYLCFYFFLKKETFFNHNRWFLLAGVIIALIFPLIVIPVEVIDEPNLVHETVFAFNDVIPVVVEKPIVQSKFQWQIIIPIIYGIGLTIFLIQFLFQFGSLIILLLKNPKDNDGIYTYVIVNNKISPFSFFKWIVYNPESFNNEELQLMLTHEKVHASQLHSIDILIIQLVCSVFWFNPLIWLYRKELRQNLEYIADYKTQEKSNSEKEYQHLLLKTSVANLNVSLSNNFYNSLIKERIVMLKKSRSNKKKQWRYLLMLPLLAGLLMSVNTENVYKETETTVEGNNNTIEFVVTKNTTDAELIAMSSTIENKGGTLVFSDIKRNTNKELINLFLKLNNHSYGYTDGTTPIDSFIIYKELYGRRGGFVGRINGATLHFDDDTNDKEIIDSLVKRAHKAITKKGFQTAQINEKPKTDITPIKIVFNKEMTDVQLDEIKKELKSNGIEMNLKHLKRNAKKEIIDINIDFKTKNGSANYNVKNENGIKSFYFKLDENGSFGVGAINKNKFVFAEQILTGKSNTESDSKARVFVFDENDENAFEVDSTHANILIKKHNGNVKHFKGLTGQDTIYFATIDSSKVKRITKLKSNIYYQDDAPVTIIRSVDNNLKNPTVRGYSTTFNNQNTKPLYIVDGKVIKNYQADALDPNNIEKINVLKGDSATQIYGKKGENGVLVITSKNPKSFTFKETKTKSPWRVEVGGVSYIDEDDPRKNSTLAYLTKYTSDIALDNHKENLKKIGITVKFTKLKRNKAGEITSIKVSLKNKKGAQSSATWKVDDGIPSIEFGETDGSLIARTSEMN
ncbi:M56 family metallopeptidase [Winogradskyella sp. PG-2]|uniref:M56 family metallopeptidase n=1 Tax=Winogradskyella sp. PG-2 TaxID=754409 RepID=UPI0004589955|nr:M56 family metallopeptidase [Winogradskyella sp. PG-2]BAO74606.1 regulatory sensor-transducer, BlaR1/MecR1 family / TonB-dependent receptor [Winogradskyella sp. PG-2]